MSLIGFKVKYNCCLSNKKIECVILDKVSLYTDINECVEDHYLVKYNDGFVGVIDVRVVDEIMYNTKK